MKLPTDPRKVLPACGLFALLLILLLHAVALPHLRSAEFQYASEDNVLPQPVILPYLGGLRPNDPSNGLYRLDIDLGPWAQPYFEIVTRFCLRNANIDDVDITFAKSNRCFWDKTELDISGPLGPGEKTVKLRTSAPGLHAGPRIFSPKGFHLSDLLGGLLVLTAGTALAVYMRRRTGNWVSSIVLCVALGVFTCWFIRSDFMWLSMDMPAHLDYVTYIYKQGELPPPHTGWEFYQPPLFYLIGTLIMAAVTPLQSFDAVTVIRLFNLCCFMTYLSFAALILRRLVKERLAQAACLTLLALWPAGIMYASRFDSHLMIYAIMGAVLYYLLRWCESGRKKHLARVITLFGIGIATRTNIFALAPLCALAAVYVWRTHGLNLREHLRSGLLWGSLLILIIGAGMNFGRTTYYKLNHAPGLPYLVGNIKHLNPVYLIKGGADKYLRLDTDSYFGEHDWQNATSESRHYFWNSLLKTSLTSQFNFFRPALTHRMYILVLALAVWTVAAAAFYRRHLPPFALAASACLLFSLIAMLMINRHLHPFGPSQDMRYIYPCMIGFAGLYGLLCEYFLKNKLYIQLSIHLTLMLLLIGCGLKLYLG